MSLRIEYNSIPRVEDLTNGLQKPTSRTENMEFDWNVW
jgi:hypothetical protein